MPQESENECKMMIAVEQGTGWRPVRCIVSTNTSDRKTLYSIFSLSHAVELLMLLYDAKPNELELVERWT